MINGFLEDDNCDKCIDYELNRGQTQEIAEKVCDLRINFTKRWYNWGKLRSESLHTGLE